MPAKASAVDLDNAILAYISGESSQDASKKFHTSESRLTRTKLSINHIPLSTEEIANRYSSGESEKALAEAYNVSRCVIARHLKMASVERRTTSQANVIRAAGMTPEQRKLAAMAAHEAARGRQQSLNEKIQRAETRQTRQRGVSPSEMLLREWLMQRGIDTIPQMAVGPYNVDIGTDTIAVEIFGGSWHGSGKHRETAPERCRYLLDRGFNLIIIWTDSSRWPLSPVTADYVASFIQLTSSNPPIRGQYRVIWGDGKEVPSCCLNIDNLSIKPSRRAANNSRS
jgi:very-short-patch-repair endonuclease